eukprot:5367309-Amphidinium_carterae.1
MHCRITSPSTSLVPDAFHQSLPCQPVEVKSCNCTDARSLKHHSCMKLGKSLAMCFDMLLIPRV